MVVRLPCSLERVDRDFQHHPLLRVHVRGLARRDAEVGGVELIDAIHEATPAGVHVPCRVRIVVVELVDIPPVGRNLADRIDAVVDELPQRLRRVGPTWKATPHADDRDRLRGQRIAVSQLRADPIGEQRQLDRRHRGLLGRVAHRAPLPSSAASASSSLRLSTSDANGPGLESTGGVIAADRSAGAPACPSRSSTNAASSRTDG
jgi:hypothetical protein